MLVPPRDTRRRAVLLAATGRLHPVTLSLPHRGLFMPRSASRPDSDLLPIIRKRELHLAPYIEIEGTKELYWDTHLSDLGQRARSIPHRTDASHG